MVCEEIHSFVAIQVVRGIPKLEYEGEGNRKGKGEERKKEEGGEDEG